MSSHRPWCRRSVPTEQQLHQCVGANRPPSTPTQTVGIAEASHDPDSNPRAPAWCRRSVPRDRLTHVRMSLARPKKTMVSLERPKIDRGHLKSLLECAAHGRSSQCGTYSSRVQQHLGPSWSVRHLAAPRSVGPVVSTKQLRPSVLQTSELRECILAAPVPNFKIAEMCAAEQSERVSLPDHCHHFGPCEMCRSLCTNR